MVKVKFSVIQYNEGPEGAEIVFSHGEKFYRIPIEKAPKDYLETRKQWLFLINEKEVEIDLSQAEEIPSTYPLAPSE